MKKMIAVLLCCAMLGLMTGSACAQETVDLILGMPTTQAFTEEAVAQEDVEQILAAGLAATSAMNQQPWHFVALSNQAIMDEIAAAMQGGMPQGAPGGEKPEAPVDGQKAPEMPKAPTDGEEADGQAAPAAMGAKAALGDSPLAIIIYKSEGAMSSTSDFDCGLACQNMVIAAGALGYGTKIVSSPTIALNGEQHDAICEKLGVDTSMQAVAVLLVGRADTDATSAATTRETMETKVSFVQ